MLKNFPHTNYFSIITVGYSFINVIRSFTWICLFLWVWGDNSFSYCFNDVFLLCSVLATMFCVFCYYSHHIDSSLSSFMFKTFCYCLYWSIWFLSSSSIVIFDIVLLNIDYLVKRSEWFTELLIGWRHTVALATVHFIMMVD